MKIGDGGSSPPRPVGPGEPKPAAAASEPTRTGGPDAFERTAGASPSTPFRSVAPPHLLAATEGRYREARQRVWNDACADALNDARAILGALPPEDRAPATMAAQRVADGAAATLDALYGQELARTEERLQTLPMEDRAAAEQQALARALARYEANGHVALDAGRSHVSQRTGDPNRVNGNCAFASSLMALRYLGLPAPAADPANPRVPAGDSQSYQRTMVLRSLGGAGTDDTIWGSPAQAVAALRAAGAEAAVVPNTWGANKEEAVELMRSLLLDSRRSVALIAGGNPHNGWPDEVAHDGGHFVTVVAYDRAREAFTVLDPLASHPLQVTADQLAAYLRDPVTTETGAVGEGIYAGELVRVSLP